jgi:Mrp family chromosome partitioning ATPase
VVHHDASNVNFLCAGSKTPNPLELLSSQEFTFLLNKLSDDYEMIVFDTPPCLAVSDAYVIANQVDSIIFVIKADGTKIPAIRKSVGRFHTLGIKMPSVILNKVNFESWSKYEYYYSSGYGK